LYILVSVVGEGRGEFPRPEIGEKSEDILAMGTDDWKERLVQGKTACKHDRDVQCIQSYYEILTSKITYSRNLRMILLEEFKMLRR
jgi:hypothetical protein